MIQSVLRRENAVTVGLLEAVAIYLIYQHEMPTAADVRTVAPHNEDLESSRKQAAWMSAALIGATFAITRDLNAFILGGIAMLGIDMSYKHSNAVNPATGRAEVGNGGQSLYGMPSYNDTDAVA